MAIDVLRLAMRPKRAFSTSLPQRAFSTSLPQRAFSTTHPKRKQELMSGDVFHRSAQDKSYRTTGERPHPNATQTLSTAHTIQLRSYLIGPSKDLREFTLSTAAMINTCAKPCDWMKCPAPAADGPMDEDKQPDSVAEIGRSGPASKGRPRSGLFVVILRFGWVFRLAPILWPVDVHTPALPLFTWCGSRRRARRLGTG
jgi:hypothetical protein